MKKHVIYRDSNLQQQYQPQQAQQQQRQFQQQAQQQQRPQQQQPQQQQYQQQPQQQYQPQQQQQQYQPQQQQQQYQQQQQQQQYQYQPPQQQFYQEQQNNFAQEQPAQYAQQRRPLQQQQQPQQLTLGGGTAYGSAATGYPEGRYSAASPAIKPPQFLRNPPSQSVKEGESARFDAKVGGNPMPSVEWYRSDGTRLEHSGKYQQQFSPDGTTSLIINGCSAEDADTYQVVASNDGGAAQARCSLNVLQQQANQSAPPQFVGKFQSVSVYQGDSLTLYCKAVGEGIQMTWFKDNQQIQPGQAPYKVSTQGGGNESTLQIQGARLEDAGWYQCNASNSAGTTSLKGRVVVQTKQTPQPAAPREQFTLRKVDRRDIRMGGRQDDDLPPPSTEAPQFLTQLPTLVLTDGQSAVFDCKFTPANDPNLKIAWLLNGHAILASSRVSTMADFGYAVLEINPCALQDAGEYTVVAVNQLGEARMSAQLQVHGYRSVYTDSAHPDSLQQITQMESRRGQASSRGSAYDERASRDRPNFH
uniref:Ig-like domain-containing protein n=1 Tax=Plectus sambesii TaxID=2011161 RepID=A0A914XU94_9BILA